MENKGIIEEIIYNEEKKYYQLKISGRSYKTFDKTEAHNQLTSKEFKVGETVGFDYKESPNPKYPQSPYKNIIKLIKVDQPTFTEKIATPGVEAKAPDWDAKDRRIVRMASINAANEFLRTNQIGLPDEAKMISEVSLFKVAEMIENWVYRKNLGDIE